MLLALALLAGLTACGGAKGTEPATAAEAEPAAAGPYKWESITFELNNVTEELGALAAQLKTPEGKYVLAVFQITDGQIEVSRLDELVMAPGNMTLGDYAPAAMSASGITIENDLAYAMGYIQVIFDVPADFDAQNAAVAVNENIAA